MRRVIHYTLVVLAFIAGSMVVTHTQPVDLTTQLTKFLVDLRAGTLGVANPISSVVVTDHISGPGTVASTGDVRLQSQGVISARNAANNGDNALIGTLANDVVFFDNADKGLSISGGRIATSAAGKFTSVGNATTVGFGVPAIVADTRLTGQTGAVASVVTYTPTADGTFEVSGNVNVTAGTTYTFQEQVTWTDETGTAYTWPLIWVNSAGSTGYSITNASGNVPRPMITITLRCKANTAITILTQASGTYTSVTYNVEGIIKQISFLFPIPLLFRRRRQSFRDLCRSERLKRAT